MNKVLLIHGPNLNLLGTREPERYGNLSSEYIVKRLNQLKIVDQVDYFQSNDESALIQAIQEAGGTHAGVLINAGAYSHTSIGMADALRSIHIPKLSIHISNIYNREAYRHFDLVGEACNGSIVGLGLEGYTLALEHISEMFN